MIVNEIVSYIEMTSRNELVAGRTPPKPLRLDQRGPESWELLAETFIRIGDFVGKGFQTRRIPPWTEDQWRTRLSKPEITALVGCVDDEIAGYVELEAHPDGEQEIVVFGLVPEFIGQGFGGPFLTLAVDAAWAARRADGLAVRRVWLHTCTRDHPSALPNYLARGFRVFRTEEREREVSLSYRPPTTD